MRVDFKELYKPYSKKTPLEDTLTWLFKTAKNVGISEELINKAINETFLEMANGKKFPTDGGDTGFDGYPHAVLNHYMLKKAIELNTISIEAYRQATEGRVQVRLNALVKRRWEKSWFNWDESEVFKAFNFLKEKLRRK